MTTSRSDGPEWPLRIGDEPVGPLRVWDGPDGEELIALHPLYAALGEHYAPEKSGLAAVRVVNRVLVEIRDGDRRLPDAIAETTLAYDTLQQANGCPDENIADLVELLRR